MCFLLEILEPLDQAVRGSCVSFESLEPLDQAVVGCVFPSRAWEPLDQAVRGSCVSFESLGAVESSSTRIVCLLRELGSHLGSSSTRTKYIHKVHT